MPRVSSLPTPGDFHDRWAEYHRAGLAIPGRPTAYSLEQREKEALGLVAEYVHEFRPELDIALVRTIMAGELEERLRALEDRGGGQGAGVSYGLPATLL